MRKIDLHTHSSCSDGTDSPEELVHKAFSADLQAVALCDHDTFAGLTAARAAIRQENKKRPAHRQLEFVPAVEISSSWEGITVHMLAYYCAENSSELLEMFTHQRQLRRERIYRMYERISKDYPLDWEDVLAQVNPSIATYGQPGQEAATEKSSDAASVAKPIGRPHLADALVAKGYFPNRTEVFQQILHPSKPYYLHYQAVDPFTVIEKVRGAGGVPVFAHPRAMQRQRRFLGFEVIRKMRDKGLFALEVTHPEQRPEQQALLRGWCAELGMPYTGGSDYHGNGKPNRLGDGYTSAEVYERLKQEANLRQTN